MPIIGGGLINPSNQGTGGSSSQLALSDGLACFTASFSGITSTQFSHGLGTTDLVVEFKDSAGNLLIPDNWFIVNSNVIQAEFSPAATGDVTVVGCIESGLAPITGGVTTIEGLSGVVDVDSPNGSILISTSGQILQLNALFTSASGAILQQHITDLLDLSGLISAVAGDAGQTSINGLSGQLALTSPNSSIGIGDNGQAIELSGIFTWASGQLVDQLIEDLSSVSGVSATAAQKAVLFFTPTSGTEFVMEHGLQTEDFLFNLWRTDTSPIATVIPDNVYPSGSNHVVISLNTSMSGKLILTG